jgi:hypothetical protein
MGIITVNILVSALPVILPAMYRPTIKIENLIEKGILFQLIIVGKILINKKTIIIPLYGNLSKVPGCCSLYE